MRGLEFHREKRTGQTAKAGFILADVGINFAVSAFKICIADDGGPAMPGAGNVNHVEVVFFNDPVQVRINEILPGRRAPMSEQHVLHIRECQRSLQQRVVVEIDLSNGQVIGGSPVGVDLLKQFCRKSVCLHGVIPTFR
jgi:hypothetical protein